MVKALFLIWLILLTAKDKKLALLTILSVTPFLN